jgi:hypothetical protein
MPPATQRPRAQLPGGSGNGPPILAQLGGQVTLHLSASQPGQLQRVVRRPASSHTQLQLESLMRFYPDAKAPGVVL